MLIDSRATKVSLLFFTNCIVGVRPCVLSKCNLLAVPFEITREIARTFTCDLGRFAPVSKMLSSVGMVCIFQISEKVTEKLVQFCDMS